MDYFFGSKKQNDKKVADCTLKELNKGVHNYRALMEYPKQEIFVSKAIEVTKFKPTRNSFFAGSDNQRYFMFTNKNLYNWDPGVVDFGELNKDVTNKGSTCKIEEIKYLMFITNNELAMENLLSKA